MDPLVLEDSIELLRKIGYSRELSIQALEASGHDLALAMAFCSRNEENAAFSTPVQILCSFIETFIDLNFSKSPLLSCH